MKDIQIVNAQDLSSLEEYAASLLWGMGSLRTLAQFHVEAFKKGLLDDEEEETGKTICWEIQRLVGLYKTQIEQIAERANIDEKAVLNHFKSIGEK